MAIMPIEVKWGISKKSLYWLTYYFFHGSGVYTV